MLVVEVIDAKRCVIQFIHCTTRTSYKKALLSGTSIVMEEEIPILEKIERVQYKDHVRVCSPQNAIEQARSRLGEQKYSVFSNNCESFVNWALTSQDVTDQGTEAAVVTAVVGMGVVAAGAAGAYGLWNFFSDGSEKDKKEDES